MNYTLHQLRIFLNITETLSITKSAAVLNLTQPAISIQLKNFQRQFDYPLIEIIQRKIHVTALGKEIAIAAESIISQVDNINYRSQNFKNNLAGHLRISIVSTGNYIMPYFLTDFLKSNKNIDLTMDVTNKSKVMRSLLDNEIDFALVSILPLDIDVHKFNLISNELYLVGNSDVVMDGSFTDQLVDTPFIYREEGSGTRQVMEKFISKNKIKVRKKLVLTSNEAVKHAIISGIGYSIMPLIGIRNEIKNGLLKIIPMKGLPLKTTWQLIWLKGKRLTPIAESYLKYLEKEKTNIIQKFSLLNQ
jgi:DNA-binding transcriptional LysR family regulator